MIANIRSATSLFLLTGPMSLFGHDLTEFRPNRKNATPEAVKFLRGHPSSKQNYLRTRKRITNSGAIRSISGSLHSTP
jgi:hypothetical protein